MHRMRLIGLGSSDAAHLPSPENGHGHKDLFRAHGPILPLILSCSGLYNSVLRFLQDVLWDKLVVGQLGPERAKDLAL